MNRNPKNQFTKGDPRINRRGRPTKRAGFVELALTVAHEPATKNGEPIVINGHVVTVLEAMVRDLAKRDPELLIAYMFGKPAAVIEGAGEDKEIVIRVVYSGTADRNPTDTA